MEIHIDLRQLIVNKHKSEEKRYSKERNLTKSTVEEFKMATNVKNLLKAGHYHKNYSKSHM